MEAPKLLLVEDDFDIRDLLKVALEDAGFDVLATRNGKEAVVELATDATRFKAIITDIDLGDLPDGWDIARNAREHVLDMPVVYMSGAGGHDWPSRGVPNSVFIAKPCVAAQL